MRWLLGISSPAQAALAPLELASTETKELQRVANYRLVLKSLRPAGIGSVIFGIIAMAIGITGFEANPVNAILALIGTFLTIEGVWLISAPAPAGMIVDGFALIILGVWNIAVTFMNASSSGGGGAGFGVLSVWQIIWGFKSFARYSRFSKTFSGSKPTSEELQRLDGIVQNINNSRMADDASVIEFTANGMSWKGRLVDTSAMFVGGAGKALIVADAIQTKVTSMGATSPSKPHKATFTISDLTMTGTISSEALQRFDSWVSRSGGSVEANQMPMAQIQQPPSLS